MVFDGSEKKAEIVINNQNFSLLEQVSDDFWHLFVGQCGAKILSKISNDHCKAFILSESSLFIWHNRLLIITCGDTKLINSLIFFLKHQDTNHLVELTYQRKQQYFTVGAKNIFNDEVKILNKYLKGTSYQLGDNKHYTSIFQYTKQLITPNQPSHELVMYQINKAISAELTQPLISNKKIKARLKLNTFLADFVIDDHVFTPYGYSLNGINQDNYLTIHITPEIDNSLISVASNLNISQLSSDLLTIFTPESFEVLTINTKKQVNIKSTNYYKKTHCQQKLTNENFSNFSHYQQLIISN